jgi:hypothetical protein
MLIGTIMFDIPYYNIQNMKISTENNIFDQPYHSNLIM